MTVRLDKNSGYILHDFYFVINLAIFVLLSMGDPNNQTHTTCAPLGKVLFSHSLGARRVCVYVCVNGHAKHTCTRMLQPVHTQ